ncbi:MAG TPA: response regulator, partial [Thermodesulfobacteriota bacterium]|nr:response regulator [Thermodesulfobacteriota bacterium]
MSTRMIKTLLVEDNESYARLVVKMLAGGNGGFDIESVDTLAKGIGFLEEKVFDLVLLDLHLPDSEGLKTFIEIHERYPGIPVIVLTGTSDEDTAVKAVQLGAQDYLVKGEMEILQLSRSIKYALERQREINKRKLTEQALFEEKERLAVTLTSIGDGVITTDTEGRVTLINRVAERLTGWSHADAEGRFIEEVFFIVNVETGEKKENPVSKAINANNVVGLESGTVLITRGREGCRYVSASCSPIRDRDGIIIGVVLVFRDITELKKLEEELLKVQKLESIGVLAGGVAHDFNNLLTSIMGNISLSSLPDISDEKVKRSLLQALKACHKAKDLSSQLLTFSKGGAIENRNVVSLDKVIRETANFTMSGSDIDFDFIVDDKLWTVEVDEGQISQVISNMLINAAQAMTNQGKITIRIENVESRKEKGVPLDDGKYVKTTITDEGIGIPKEYLSRIFDPYFTTKQSGSGLGLSTSYSIIKNHGGYITVESELHVGTKFVIYLPAKGYSVSAEVSIESRIKKGRGRVLIMDDKMEVREAAGEMLRHMGYEVEFAKDGSEALKLYKRAKMESMPFDTVIMDLTVPGGMGGKEAIEKLLVFDPGVKAIVSSGYS